VDLERLRHSLEKATSQVAPTLTDESHDE
jgi:hypothetical protein